MSAIVVNPNPNDVILNKTSFIYTRLFLQDTIYYREDTIYIYILDKIASFKIIKGMTEISGRDNSWHDPTNTSLPKTLWRSNFGL